jgi:hypothetical protein
MALSVTELGVRRGQRELRGLGLDRAYETAQLTADSDAARRKRPASIQMTGGWSGRAEANPWSAFPTHPIPGGCSSGSACSSRALVFLQRGFGFPDNSSDET